VIMNKYLKNILYIGSLLLCLISHTAFCQRYINGCIIDSDDGRPIPSATVFFSNTTMGTTTDLKGNYKLKIPGEGSCTLTVSHVGYQSVVKEIEPGRSSVEFNVAMQLQELDEVAISAGVRFRQRDINLFWKTILGKKPSGRTIRATNSDKVYYFYNPQTKILKVTCWEPIQILNYETGYYIHFILNYFLHDYNTGISQWNYQYVFTELDPTNLRQKDIWDKNRERVYDVSITKFIKSLYNNSLYNDGFALASITPNTDPRMLAQFKLVSLENILSPNLVENSKTFDLKKENVILFCYGRPINNYDLEMLQRGVGKGLYENFLLGDSIQIFSDGSFSNQLHMSPVNLSNTLLGLCMKLPIDYLPKKICIR